MSDNRVELNDMMMDEVAGGTAFSRETPTSGKIGIDKDHMIYSYDNLNAVRDWVVAHAKGFAPATREQDIIDGLLAAKLIY